MVNAVSNHPNVTAQNPITQNKVQSDIVNTIGGFKEDQSVSTLFLNGKLSFIYIGGEYCPYCAMERWSIVLALQEFGNFSNLGNFISSEGNVATYNFTGSNYTSNKIDFEPAEVWDNGAPPNQKPLQSLNDLQNSTYNKYGSGSIPFICIGGSVFQIGSGSSLKLNSFSGVSFNEISNQVASQSGSLYSEIKTESDYIVQIINQSYTNPRTVTTSSSISTTLTHSSNTTSSNGTTNSLNTNSMPDFSFELISFSFILILIFKKRKNF